MNTLQLINFVVGLAALAVLVPFLDRIRSMTWKKHRWSVQGMHVGMALWLGFVVHHGLIARDLADPGDVLGVIGCWCWIRMSREAWRHGPPESAESRPAPLDPIPHR